jgi:hypothetical protein
LATAATAANAASAANNPGAIVKRDSSGNFTAGTVSGSFAGDGSGLTGLDAANLAGTVPDGRLSANVALLAGNQTFAGAERLTNPANLLVGTHAGDGSGLTNLTGTLIGSASSATSFSGALAGDVSGTQQATVVATVGGVSAANLASAATAANAATAADNPGAIVRRDSNGNFAAGTISGAGFVGSGSGLTGLNAANLVGTASSAASFTGALAGDVTGTQQATVVAAVGGVSAANLASAAAAATAATAANTPGAIVKRDSSGNFNAGTVAGAFAGDGSGLTGLNAANLTGTVPDGRLSANVATGATAANAATAANTAGAIVKRDSNGNFTAGTVSGAFNGDGSSLTNLSAANLSGALPSAVAASSIPSGVMVVSALAQDASLISQGYQFVMTASAPAWVNGTSTGCLTARSGHTALWDGQEMVIWGGNISSATPTFVNSGGMYRPDLDQWTPVSTVSPPSPRAGHTAVWTGTQMIVWGGFDSSGSLNTGGRFVPSSQTWSAASTANVPAPRSGHAAVWTGTAMLIWGGKNNSGLLNDGALYDPVADQWTPLNLPNPPDARQGATAVWAGDRVLLWGGDGAGGPLNSGAELLFPANGVPTQWVAMPLDSALEPRDSHSAVWTGQTLILWGGANGGAALGDGAAFNPVANSWAALPTANAPMPSFNQVAVWTGQEMLIIGGSNGSTELSAGSAYNPSTGLWRPLSSQGGPLARAAAAGVWSGTSVIVFGGQASGLPVASLQILNPQPAWYFYRKL